MNRSQALSYLVADFSDLATETGLAQTDTSPGYGGVIDNALLALFYTATALATADVPTDQETDYKALLDYYALRRFARSLALYADIRVDAVTVDKKRSQMFANVRALLKDAQAEIEKLGYLGSANNFQTGYLNLDFREPEGQI